MRDHSDGKPSTGMARVSQNRLGHFGARHRTYQMLQRHPDRPGSQEIISKARAWGNDRSKARGTRPDISARTTAFMSLSNLVATDPVHNTGSRVVVYLSLGDLPC